VEIANGRGHLGDRSRSGLHQSISGSAEIGVPVANVFRNPEYSLFLTPSHIVKYHFVVHIVTRKHLHEAMRQYPDAANEIKTWVVMVKEVRWHNFPQVRSTFKDADNVKGYVIFNIRQNRYRLVTVIHYAKTTNEKRTRGHVYIRSFLTHKEYDNPANWDRKFGTK
jgi:mRNA interferase HigB